MRLIVRVACLARSETRTPFSQPSVAKFTATVSLPSLGFFPTLRPTEVERDKSYPSSC